MRDSVKVMMYTNVEIVDNENFMILRPSNYFLALLRLSLFHSAIQTKTTSVLYQFSLQKIKTLFKNTWF